jgi:predicted DNA-binding transcriptional regulator YafY
MMSRSTRLLLLLQALRGRRHPTTAANLAGELEVSERTIYRDVATLVAQGAPVEGEAGVGYVLRPGFFLPPLMLDEDEIEAVLLGLRYVDQRGDAVLTKAASSALAKIGSVLSPEAQQAMAVPLAMPGPPVDTFPKNAVPLAVFRDAIRAQKRLDLDYRDVTGRSSRRVVWPIQLGFMDNARVLSAWCELRQDFRMFRTDRVVAAAAGERYPERRSELLRRFHVHLKVDETRRITPDRN